MSQRHIGIFWIILAVSGYAFLPVFTRQLYLNSELIPTDIALWRFVIASPSIWLILFIQQKFAKHKRKLSDSRSQILKLMGIGIFYAAAALCAFFGLQYIPAGTYVVLFYTYPAFVAVISIFLGQRLQAVAWFALALTLIGVVLAVPNLSFAGENTSLGISIALLNALVVAVYFSIIGGIMEKASSIIRGSAWVVTGTLGYLLLTIPFFGIRTPDNTLTWLLLIGMAVISTALPILFTNMAIQAIGATQASIIATAEPILTTFLAFILLGETVLAIQLLGAAFIIAGVILLELRSRQKLTA